MALPGLTSTDLTVLTMVVAVVWLFWTVVRWASPGFYRSVTRRAASRPGSSFLVGAVSVWAVMLSIPAVLWVTGLVGRLVGLPWLFWYGVTYMVIVLALGVVLGPFLLWVTGLAVGRWILVLAGRHREPAGRRWELRDDLLAGGVGTVFVVGAFLLLHPLLIGGIPQRIPYHPGPSLLLGHGAGALLTVLYGAVRE